MDLLAGDKKIDLTPMSRQLLDYWRTRKGDAKLPPREAIDVICDLPGLAANILFIEVLAGADGTMQFRYRVVGTVLVDRARRDATGRMLNEEIYGEHLEEVLAPLRLVVETGRPVRVCGLARGVKVRVTPMEFLCVPVAGKDPDAVAYILGVVSFDRRIDDPNFEAHATDVLHQDFWS